MTEQEFTDKYCCTDSHAEYCNDDCDSCERKFKKDLEVIKERIRADVIDECEENIIPTLYELDAEQEVIDCVQKWFEQLKEQMKLKKE